MNRIHLFEFEDLEWFPKALRDYGTDFLQFLSNRTKLFRPALPKLRQLLDDTGSTEIIDLASGGGGGLLWLIKELRKEMPALRTTLTDYYPNLNAFRFTAKQEPGISFAIERVDAREVPEHFSGVRTMFLSFHHFRPGDAQRILENAVKSGQPIFIAEGQERSLPSILAMLFSPVSVLLTTPLIRPFRWGRLIFTYLIPVVPLFVLWDGVISCLRTYSIKEMKEMIDQVPNKDTFRWETGRMRSGPAAVLYLSGRPK